MVCGGSGSTSFRNPFFWGDIKKLCYTKRSFEIVTTSEIRHKFKMEKNKYVSLTLTNIYPKNGKKIKLIDSVVNSKYIMSCKFEML